jgi:hypothetical protein
MSRFLENVPSGDPFTPVIRGNDLPMELSKQEKIKKLKNFDQQC